jgi:hypothetical protein
MQDPSFTDEASLSTEQQLMLFQSDPEANIIGIQILTTD